MLASIGRHVSASIAWLGALLVLPCIALVACGGGATTRDAAADGAEDGRVTEVDESHAVAELKSPLERAEPEVGAEVTAGAREFETAWSLYRLVEAPDENQIYSPFSLVTAVSMLAAAAGGTTLEQIQAVLGFEGPEEALHVETNALVQHLLGMAKTGTSSRNPLEFEVSNDLWLAAPAEPAAELLDWLALYYGAGVHLADFANRTEEVRVVINSKISGDTHELIPELITPGLLKASTVFVLTNALYLSARWARPFPIEKTDLGSFTTGSGVVNEVPMMSAETEALHAEQDGLQVLALPFEGRGLEMVFVVPDAGTFEATVGSMSAQRILNALGAMTSTPVTLRLPKFTVHNTLPSVKQALIAAGMTDAFGPEADFWKFGSSSPVSQVLHEAHIAVDEEGCEAAAATAILGTPSSGLVGERVSIVIDRPFLFFVHDPSTRAVLFMGHVVDPLM